MDRDRVIYSAVFGIIIGLYFWNLLKNQRTQKVTIDKESKKEMERLRKMRAISLSEPLSEKVRPKSFQDIVGQEDGIKALKAALCGPNPQHVIVYGPPGVGKTAAARLVLEEAKNINNHRLKNRLFLWNSMRQQLVLMKEELPIRSSALSMTPYTKGPEQWDRRGFRTEAGAVTHAHGGVLFIDEIGSRILFK